MSGYSEAEVRFARLAAAIAEAGTLRRRILDAAAGAAQTAGALELEIDDARTSTPGVEGALRALTVKLGQAKDESARLHRSVEQIDVPERTAVTTEAQVAAVRRRLDAASAEASRLDDHVRQVRTDFVTTSVADAALAAARASLLEGDAAVRAGRELLERWSPGQAERLDEAIGAALDEVRALVAAPPAADRLRAAGEELSRRGGEIVGAAHALLATAEEKQAAHERRLYVLKGLRDVCSRLGFREIDGPRYEGDASGAIVLAVDTKGKGEIAFRLGLDAVIEADSRMNARYCPTEFGKFSDELTALYGVQSQFVHEGEGPRPARRTFDAKDLPKDSRARHAER